MTVHVIKPDISNQWLQETGSTCTPQWSASYGYPLEFNFIHGNVVNLPNKDLGIYGMVLFT